MIFSLQKYHHYLLANHFMLYINHQALKYLVNRPLHHGQICRWLILSKEFEFEVVIQLGKTNIGLDHLSIIGIGEDLLGIDNDLIDTNLFRVEAVPER